MLFAQYWNTQCWHKMFFAIFSSVFFPFCKHKDFLPFLFLKSQRSIDSTFPVTETYQCEHSLEQKIIHLEIKNFLRIIHFRHNIYLLKHDNNMWNLFKVKSKDTRTKSVMAKFKLYTFTKELCFRHVVYMHCFVLSFWMAPILSYY